MIKLNETLLNEFWVDLETDKFTPETNWSNPDLRPCKWDKNFESWLERIGNWGTLEFIHTDPEHKISRKKITRNVFLDKLSTSDLLKLYGKFRVELIDVATVEFIRDYVGLDGKMYSEVLRLHVRLREELKKGLHFITRIWN